MKRGGPLKRTGSLRRTGIRRTAPPEGDDEKYKAWQRTQPCEVCGAPPPSEPSHVGTRGDGQKCSDVGALPSCRDCHDAWHAGVPTFLARLRACGWHKVTDVRAWVEERIGLRNREYGRHLGGRGAMF